MWVAESVRGLGVGRRLLTAVEEHAAAAGVRTLGLRTNRALDEAIALYRSAEYRGVPATQHDLEGSSPSTHLKRVPVDDDPAGDVP